MSGNMQGTTQPAQSMGSTSGNGSPQNSLGGFGGDLPGGGPPSGIPSNTFQGSMLNRSQMGMMPGGGFQGGMLGGFGGGGLGGLMSLYGGGQSSMFGSPAYYNQFSQMPSPHMFGYYPTYQRQYPTAQPMYPNWGMTNTLFRAPTQSAGVQLPGSGGSLGYQSTQAQQQAQQAQSRLPWDWGNSGDPMNYARGGVVALASGDYLKGETDGMADELPANIDGQQEAALSHGEFVVPADVVADLGNGNNDAGASRLYSMMERVRKARHGTTEQPPEIDAEKYLPE